MLPSKRWLTLSPRVRVQTLPDYNQDSILLIELDREVLIQNINDAHDRGWWPHVRRLARDYPQVFLLRINGWGDATMINLFAEDAVFLGTDASERWTKKQFQAYARPHFQKGQGWNYRASERNVRVDPKGEYAWFDELLTNRKLGQCRGSGLLRRVEGEWKVVLYDLSIPIPNELAEEVVEKIKARETPKSE